MLLYFSILKHNGAKIEVCGLYCTRKNRCLKIHRQEIFDTRFFHEFFSPLVLIIWFKPFYFLFEYSHRYLRSKVDHWCRWHRWSKSIIRDIFSVVRESDTDWFFTYRVVFYQLCFKRERQAINLSTVLSPVSTTPTINLHYRWCQRHGDNLMTSFNNASDKL